MKTQVEKNQVNFSFGGTLEAWQVEEILTGNAGNRATNEQIREELLSEGWNIEWIDEFIEFINSNLINELF